MSIVAEAKLKAADWEALARQVESDYRARTPASAEMHKRARLSLAGGVSGNLRYFSPYPLYIDDCAGSAVTDIDGNQYIDCFGANGPLLLGHRHPELVAAVEKVQKLGALPLNPVVMVECAELVAEIVPCAEQVRFLNTGTEAVMTAVRCARAFTGKTGIVKFHGHYHGQQDQFLFGIDNTDARFSDGVPKTVISGIHLCHYLDIDEVRDLLARDRDIAAVILDPAMHAGGLWGSDADKLTALRELTSRHGVLLLFDEVISGCRLAPGGAQEYFAVTPDLVTMAKALAAGEKLALVAGRADVLGVVDPCAVPGTPRVFQSGTVNDGPAALASACAALRTYRSLAEAGAYQRLEQQSRRTADCIEKEFRRVGIPCQVNHLASMMQVHLGADQVSFESARADYTRVIELFYLALINHGVLLSLPTSNHIYFSFAHSDDDFESVRQKISYVLEYYDFGAVCTQ